ncbi:peptide chain release factor N(5)-glutamine methyltransferase [Leptothermofonsia sp. ETS-13]|uniref:peptide chain release factor N(5)-glutamine methyltransferase n=1 Tax=Leptothermofonsia sp. ETS-13 TaxID=3035696 RepID=UPI003B9EC820
MTNFDSFSNKLSSPLLRRGFVVSGQVLWEWWQAARQEANTASIPSTEVDWLVQELAGLDRLALRLETFKTQPQVRLEIPFVELQKLWQKRIQERVPVQYLAGVAPWRQFRLKVSPAVLIPRPETEVLIDLAIAAVTTPEAQFTPPLPLSIPHWADLGTGSGAIALGLAGAFPQATIHAVDCSQEALAIAQHNAETYHLQNRIHFYQGSWLQPLEHLKGQLSGIVSNPPYIPSDLISELQPEVAQHEPHLALDGGVDGLDCIRHLVATAPVYLQPGGILLFEMMAGQAIAVTDLLHQQGSYHPIQIYPDLAGIDRFALAFRK